MLAARGTPMDLEAELADVDVLAPGVALVHVTTTWPGVATPEDRDGPTGAVMTWVVVEEDAAGSHSSQPEEP